MVGNWREVCGELKYFVDCRSDDDVYDYGWDEKVINRCTRDDDVHGCDGDDGRCNHMFDEHSVGEDVEWRGITPLMTTSMMSRLAKRRRDYIQKTMGDKMPNIDITNELKDLIMFYEEQLSDLEEKKEILHSVMLDGNASYIEAYYEHRNVEDKLNDLKHKILNKECGDCNDREDSDRECEE